VLSAPSPRQHRLGLAPHLSALHLYVDLLLSHFLTTNSLDSTFQAGGRILTEATVTMEDSARQNAAAMNASSALLSLPGGKSARWRRKSSRAYIYRSWPVPRLEFWTLTHYQYRHQDVNILSLLLAAAGVPNVTFIVINQDAWAVGYTADIQRLFSRETSLRTSLGTPLAKSLRRLLVFVDKWHRPQIQAIFDPRLVRTLRGEGQKECSAVWNIEFLTQRWDVRF
jgi:hypothetical protein